MVSIQERPFGHTEDTRDHTRTLSMDLNGATITFICNTSNDALDATDGSPNCHCMRCSRRCNNVQKAMEPKQAGKHNVALRLCNWTTTLRERERESQNYIHREGGKSLLADVKGMDPYLIQIGPLPFGAQRT